LKEKGEKERRVKHVRAPVVLYGVYQGRENLQPMNKSTPNLDPISEEARHCTLAAPAAEQ
jgi:hypothetical protein